MCNFSRDPREDQDSAGSGCPPPGATIVQTREFSRQDLAELMAWLSKIEARSYATYKARLEAANRLRTRGQIWSIVLIALSAGTTVVGVANLYDTEIFSKSASLFFLVTSIATLITSLVLTSMNYANRARDMFENYRHIQRLSCEIEEALVGLKSGTAANRLACSASDLAKRYQDLLDGSDNHTTADQLRTKAVSSNFSKQERRQLRTQTAGTYLPLTLLMIPAGITLRILVWTFW
jgi:hypothetical protein